MTDACDLTRKTSDCMILTYLVLSCVVGMVFCQNILWIDRSLPRYPALHNRFCRVFAIILSSITTIIAFVLPFLLLRNDPYNDVVLTCMILPSGSAPQINRLFYSFVGLGLLALAALVSLYLINQRREKMWRYCVRNSFQAVENQLITKWVGVLVSVQFVFLTAYSLAVYLIRTRGQALPKITREVLRMWFYLVPFSTVSLPLISLLALRHFAKERHASINRLTHMKNDHSTHMEQLMRMWS
ncbi:integral membrane protein [Cooperia oncophora]